MLLSELHGVSKTTYLDYHSTLSTKIWDDVNTLNKDVLEALQNIADAFIEALDVPADSVEDVIITGSLCNYNYTKYSDIDLHVILDYSKICDNCEQFSVDECLLAKKSLWNLEHDITIYGIEVELYAQDVNKPITGDAGVYSILNDEWIKRPTKLKNVTFDEDSIEDKAEYFRKQIDDVVDGKVDNPKVIDALKMKIKNMRKAGLEKSGEFSLENLVFKTLRSSEYIAKLHDYSKEIKSDSLSLE